MVPRKTALWRNRVHDRERRQHHVVKKEKWSTRRPLYEGKSPGSIAAKRLENQKRLGIVPPSAELGMRNKFNPAGYEKNWEPIHLSSRGSQ